MGWSNRRIWHIAAYIIKSRLAVSSPDEFLVCLACAIIGSPSITATTILFLQCRPNSDARKVEGRCTLLNPPNFTLRGYSGGKNKTRTTGDQKRVAPYFIHGDILVSYTPQTLLFLLFPMAYSSCRPTAGFQSGGGFWISAVTERRERCWSLLGELRTIWPKKRNLLSVTMITERLAAFTSDFSDSHMSPEIFAIL